ncbi:MAG: hypothetical protein II061_02355, partial [Bacteroidaceae bacterium]|nr:hypothetical protein [Bacteroidaceae bacterium]
MRLFYFPSRFFSTANLPPFHQTNRGFSLFRGRKSPNLRKKPFKKKREQKRIKTLKERRQIMKKVQEEYKLKSTFSSNDFDKIISP